MIFPSVSTTRILVMLLAAVLAVQFAGSGSASGAELEQPPKFVGLASQDYHPDAGTYATQVGEAPDFRQLFWGLEHTWPNHWAPAELDDLEAMGTVAYVEITTPDFAGFLSGAQDAKLDGLVATIKGWVEAQPGRRILLAPLPEANLNDFPWGGNPSQYVAGYHKIRDAFRDAGVGPGEARFVFAMHGTSSPGLAMADFYPGDAFVDIIGFSIINRNNPWHDYDSAFQRFLDEIKSTIGQTKPILVTQTASVTEGQDRAGWFDDMYSGLGGDSQVIGIIYFNRAKQEGGKFNDYRVIIDAWIDPAFRSGAIAWSASAGTQWIFDGSMDAWVDDRTEVFANAPYFVDVVGSPFEPDVLWLASEGITQGCNPPTNDRFCPGDTVTRGQMAAFLTRALSLPASGTSDPFTDDDSSVFEEDIERMAAAGITAGCNPPTNDRFCPDKTVTRGQMAAFLARALGLPASGASNPFTDDDDSVFEQDIERLAAAGITAGCNPPTNDRFCPEAKVTRGQMAAFLARALGP